MKSSIRILLYKFMSKKIDEDKLEIRKINVKPTETSYFNLSTNSLMIINYEGKKYYFRECPQIMEEKEYFERSIARFFSTLDGLKVDKEHLAQKIPINLSFSDSCICGFKQYLRVLWNETSFPKKMKKIDKVSEKINFNIWTNEEYNKGFFEAFGMTELSELYYEIGIYFLWYMRTVAQNYRVIDIVRGENHSFFGGVKTISTRIVAEELGMGDLVTDVSWCELKIEGMFPVLGLLCEIAPGNRMIDIKMEATITLQRELLKLNVLDVLCFQRDHGPNNYNISVNENHEVSVCAFDNDHPYTFMPLPTIFISMAGCAPLVSKNGLVFRPYLDEKIENALQQLDIERLTYRLKPYLNCLQIYAVVYRAKRLKRAINKTKKRKDDFLVSSEMWSTQNVLDEMSGAYGITYLTKAIHRGVKNSEGE